MINNTDIIDIFTDWKCTFGNNTKKGPQGPPGESVYDIYRSIKGNEDKTKEDFINDIAQLTAKYMKEEGEKENESC